MKIVRKLLTDAEFSPANKRYILETDMVQTSPDGGTTWYDDPESDPRHNPFNRLPPREGETAQCDAAEAMMQHFKAQVDAFLTSAGILGLVNVWVALLFFIPGVNIIVALFFSIAEALFVTGTVVVEAAMTEEVYDQIKCILFCHIDEDGQMSAVQLEAVNNDVTVEIGGVAAEVFTLVTSAWGEVGFSNAGASGEYSGDCDDCTCEWCYTWDFLIESYAGDGFQTAPGFDGYGEWVADNGWVGQPNPGLVLSLPFADTEITKVEWFGKTVGGSGFVAAVYYRLDGSTLHTDFATVATGTGGEYTCHNDRVETVDELWFNPSAGSSSTQYIFTITLHGTGTNPFGADNC